MHFFGQTWGEKEEKAFLYNITFLVTFEALSDVTHYTYREERKAS